MEELKDVAKHLWTILVPVGWWVWDKQDSRLKNLEDKMFTRDEAKDRQESINDSLEARRQDVIALHSKIDTKSDNLNSKIDTLSRDMNAGISEIKTILLERK